MLMCILQPFENDEKQAFTLGSPEINGNIFFLLNMYIHVCIIYACGMNCTQSPTVLIIIVSLVTRHVNIIHIISYDIIYMFT